MKILVVEDDSQFREMLVRCLRRRGFETYGAANIYETRALLEEFTPDLVFFDPYLPKDVTAEFQELRRIHKLKKVIIMFDHSYFMEKYAYEGSLNKPFNLLDLSAFLL